MQQNKCHNQLLRIGPKNSKNTKNEELELKLKLMRRNVLELMQKKKIIVLTVSWCSHCTRLKEDLTGPEKNKIKKFVVDYNLLDDKGKKSYDLTIVSFPTFIQQDRLGYYSNKKSGYSTLEQLQKFLNQL